MSRKPVGIIKASEPSKVSLKNTASTCFRLLFYHPLSCFQCDILRDAFPTHKFSLKTHVELSISMSLSCPSFCALDLGLKHFLSPSRPIYIVFEFRRLEVQPSGIPEFEVWPVAKSTPSSSSTLLISSPIPLASRYPLFQIQHFFLTLTAASLRDRRSPPESLLYKTPNHVSIYQSRYQSCSEWHLKVCLSKQSHQPPCRKFKAQGCEERDQISQDQARQQNKRINRGSNSDRLQTNTNHK